MKAYDVVHKKELEVTWDSLIDLMVNNRQVDLILHSPKTDSDDYLTWDIEHWTCIDGRRFIRCYSLRGRVLRDSTAHNIYDMKNDFFPQEAKEIQIS